VYLYLAIVPFENNKTERKLKEYIKEVSQNKNLDLSIRYNLINKNKINE
jgi:hypothetical protein